MKCALYLLLFAGCLAILIGVAVLFMTFKEEGSSVGLRSVGALFLAAGVFGILTGSLVKYGSRRFCPEPESRYSRQRGVSRELPILGRSRSDAVHVEINGAVSRLPLRHPVYDEYFYHIVKKMKERETYVPTAPPSYQEVIRDTSGKQFSFVESGPTNPPPYHWHEPHQIGLQNGLQKV